MAQLANRFVSRLGAAAALALVAFCCEPAHGQPTEAFRAMNRPAKPFRVVSNVYYVGASDIASYLVVTPQGNILIEGGFAETAPMIVSNLRELGFSVESIKLLLTSHAHFDHVGGLAELKRLTGAQLVATAPEAETMSRGGKGDFHYGDKLLFSPVTVDRVIRDGETVELGGVVLTAHLTPGHTRGSTTWTMVTMEGGVARHVVFLASLSTPGYDVVANPNYPNIGKDILRSVEILRTLPCDVFLAPHGFAFALDRKRERIGMDPNPFIDPKGYQDALTSAETEIRQKLAKAKQPD